MNGPIDHGTLHRTAKYFMDNGRAETHEEAMSLLKSFGLTVHVGPEIASSVHHQTALITLVNVARRTLLAGIEVVAMPDVTSVTPLASGHNLRQAIHDLGGRLVHSPRPDWPCAIIGAASPGLLTVPAWRLTWSGWRGGAVPVCIGGRLSDETTVPLAPALAAAACTAEAFAYFAQDHVMAGRRALGLSLWNPVADWMADDPAEPLLSFLPSRLWIIGLGNLGQAFAWLLAALPYDDPAQVQIVLQDFDRIAVSNDSTSLLSHLKDVGRKKTRVVADWLEARGFDTSLEERRFGEWTHRADHEPGAALCGVDNALARIALDGAGFGLVVETGLGAGPQAFRSISMHTFPASRTAAEIWTRQVASGPENPESMPAYQALKRQGIDRCGLTQLASRTVGVPFVGLIAGCLSIGELLRRLHQGSAIEVLSTSAAALDHVEMTQHPATVYDFGHVTAAQPPQGHRPQRPSTAEMQAMLDGAHSSR
ncbi:MAG: ThiF family adenylyltransferase [Planctomycetia bacterium]|nr:MAG: ThiF family adenylyltransferase [Planctomycetia bacterium]